MMRCMAYSQGHIVGRFAPTPSGRMHLGNVFSALLGWLAVRAAGGTMVLRIEDIDPRAQDRAVADLLMGDLAWLGLDWDEGPTYQSKRTAIYADASHGSRQPASRTPASARAPSSMPQAPRTRRTGPTSTRHVPRPLPRGGRATLGAACSRYAADGACG